MSDYAISMPVGPSPQALRRPVARFRKRGASLGLSSGNKVELLRQVQHGFPFDTLLRLEVNSGLPVAALAAVIGIPERTLARRKAAGKFEPAESERLLRIAILFEQCVELFEGDVTAAVRWLTTGKKALNDEAPLSYARTELGAREVEDLIGRVEHGVFS